MDATEFVRRHAQLDIFLTCIFRMAYAAQKTRMREQSVEPALQRRDLVRPGAVMVKHHALPVKQAQPRDPEITGINQIRLAEGAA